MPRLPNKQLCASYSLQACNPLAALRPKADASAKSFTSVLTPLWKQEGDTREDWLMPLAVQQGNCKPAYVGWKKLEVLVDSGAADCAMPPRALPNHAVTEGQASKLSLIHISEPTRPY